MFFVFYKQESSPKKRIFQQTPAATKTQPRAPPYPERKSDSDSALRERVQGVYCWRGARFVVKNQVRCVWVEGMWSLSFLWDVSGGDKGGKQKHTHTHKGIHAKNWYDCIYTMSYDLAMMDQLIQTGDVDYILGIRELSSRTSKGATEFWDSWWFRSPANQLRRIFVVFCNRFSYLT